MILVVLAVLVVSYASSMKAYLEQRNQINDLRGQIVQSKKDIGALEREVLLQFLIEAVVLAALGGLAGILIATAASYVLAQVMGVPYIFNAGVNALSFIFSAAIGVVFGYFPARRAAQLDPIEALRHE